MDDRVAALERECAELRRQLEHAKQARGTDAATFLESLLHAVPAYILRTDGDMRLIYLNRIQPGIRVEDVLGQEIWQFLDPSSLPAARRCIEQVLAEGGTASFEAIAVGPHGKPAYYETVVTPVEDPSGRTGVVIASIDVTSIHMRDLELRRSEEQLRVAVEATGIALWSWTPATNEVHWYPRTYEVYGRSQPVDLASYIDVLCHPDDREMLRANTASSLAGGPFSGPIHRIVREDGAVRWILSRGFTELDANGNPARMIGGSLDVTQQRELEEHVRHAQRLDAVGHLSAGVAHNFNNMLTVIVGTLEVLSKRLTGDSRRLADEAMQSALRGADMVRQLMTFTGQRTQPERRAHDICPVIEQIVAMCRNTFDRHINVVCTIGPDIPAIRCTANEIEQVIMNLLVNARDAVIDTGLPNRSITIAAELVAEATGSVGVRITITDNGVGMAEDVVQRAFDPFFSTKEVGRGTGLGLTTSYAIVRELGGTITCTSSPRVGTTFVITLPGTAASDQVVVSQPVVTMSRRRVLLIDDDAAVRNAIGDLLASEGFQVEAADSGDAGLAHLATDALVDIIILDRSMPGAPGESYVPRMRELAPRVPILMFTGQAVGLDVAALVDNVIVKPVPGQQLVAAIDALVEKFSGGPAGTPGLDRAAR